LTALVFLPEGRIYSGKIDVKKLKAIAKEVDYAWNAALNGELYKAMTINGLLHSLAFKQNPEIALSALNAGALAAGLSGTGPAVVALTDDRAGDIKDAWSSFEGKIIEAKTSNRQARVLT
jgi:shikimate kinase